MGSSPEAGTEQINCLLDRCVITRRTILNGGTGGVGRSAGQDQRRGWRSRNPRMGGRAERAMAISRNDAKKRCEVTSEMKKPALGGLFHFKSLGSSNLTVLVAGVGFEPTTFGL